MKYSKLENNIIDVLTEEQIKLGYRSETVRLYYPLSSLRHFLPGNEDSAEICRNAERKMGRNRNIEQGRTILFYHTAKGSGLCSRTQKGYGFYL